MSLANPSWGVKNPSPIMYGGLCARGMLEEGETPSPKGLSEIPLRKMGIELSNEGKGKK